jgi:hypothetical protein
LFLQKNSESSTSIKDRSHLFTKVLKNIQKPKCQEILDRTCFDKKICK